MADRILNDYQGESIKVNGVCYKFVGETTSSVNTIPSELGGTYDNCLECALESSSSSSSSFELMSESSSSSFGGVAFDCSLEVTGSGTTFDILNVFGQDINGRTVWEAAAFFNSVEYNDGLFRWEIIERVEFATVLYYNVTNDFNPPETGWVVDNGASPAPSFVGCVILSSSSSESNSSDSSESEGNESSSSSSREPLEKIGPLNSDPRIKMTICWVPEDLDETKNIFDQIWSRGESKIIRPSSYDALGDQEYWHYLGSFVGGIDFLATSFLNYINVQATSDKLYLFSLAGCTKSTSNLVTTGSGYYPNTCSQLGNISGTSILNSYFGFLTTNDGLTIKWEAIAGNAIGTDTWASWKGTTLSYATTLVKSGCP